KPSKSIAIPLLIRGSISNFLHSNSPIVQAQLIINPATLSLYGPSSSPSSSATISSSSGLVSWNPHVLNPDTSLATPVLVTIEQIVGPAGPNGGGTLQGGWKWPTNVQNPTSATSSLKRMLSPPLTATALDGSIGPTFVQINSVYLKGQTTED